MRLPLSGGGEGESALAKLHLAVEEKLHLTVEDLALDLRGVFVLWYRDVIRFLREKPRLLAMIGQPLTYLVALEYGLGSSMFGAEPSPLGSSYLEFLFPGILGMTVLYASILSAATIVWDREFGFLREIVAAPTSPAAIVVGKVLGGSTLALVQGSLLMFVAPFFGLKLTVLQGLQLMGLMLLVGFGITSMGVVIAPRMHSHEGFQLVMSFLVLPMFLLSGAFFPPWSVSAAMERIMLLNPLTYGVDAMRGVIYQGTLLERFISQFPLPQDIAVLGVCALVMFAAAVLSFRRQVE